MYFIVVSPFNSVAGVNDPGHSVTPAKPASQRPATATAAPANSRLFGNPANFQHRPNFDRALPRTGIRLAIAIASFRSVASTRK